jgi:hypothetical protein
MTDKTKPKFKVGQVVKVLWKGSSPEYLRITRIYKNGAEFSDDNCTLLTILRPLTARERGVRK